MSFLPMARVMAPRVKCCHGQCRRRGRPAADTGIGAAAGVQGQFAVEWGNVASKIVQRSVYTDGIVLPVNHPPEPGRGAIR